MAREGYLILDSDLHMMEPDDLWARYLEGPYQAKPPRFFGGSSRNCPKARKTKPTPTDQGMEVQGCHSGARQAPSAPLPGRELRRRSRARSPAFQCRAGARLRSDLDLTAMDIEGIDVAVMYGTRGRQILCHDDLAPDYAAALARAYNNWAS